MIDIGTGPPLVRVPGIQGRWAWIAPTARALSASFRVLSASMPGEPGSGMAHDRRVGFSMFVEQLDRMLDAAAVERAVICGVSFGGLVSVAFAARHPSRVSALVLASAPGPRWKPDPRVEDYMRAPVRSIPSFVWSAAGRLYPEVTTALPATGARLAFLARHVSRILAAPMSPRRMADRVALAGTVDFVDACRRITVPTLVVAGEPELDRVVSVAGMADYIELIRNARFTTIAGGGHIGMVTRAQAFASLVSGFVATGSAPVRLEADQARGDGRRRVA
jgi:pimeloyl-ACP methyl ester carboxylesterase